MTPFDGFSQPAVAVNSPSGSGTLTPSPTTSVSSAGERSFGVGIWKLDIVFFVLILTVTLF